MDSLLAISDSLSLGEIRLVQHFYRIKGNADSTKRGKLFELLIKRAPASENEIAGALGYTNPGSSFQNLKQRLKADILSVLLMQECTSKFCTPYAQATFDCRRSLIQGEILMSRGVYDEAMEILVKAMKTANKYQLYAEQLQIEDLIRNHNALKGNINTYNSLSNSIESNYHLLGDLLVAKRKHYELTNPRLMGVKSLPDYLEQGKKVMDELSALSSAVKSSRISMFRNLAAINYFSASRDFKKAESHAHSLVEAFGKDQVVLSKSNLAGANLELANIYLNTQDYPLATQFAQKAVDLFKPGMINQLHAYIMLFFATFRNEEFDKATEILNIAQNHRLIKSKNHPQMLSRIKLLKAALLFRQGDIEKSSYVLNRENAGSREKDDWIPGFYMLDLLIMMEKKASDLANYKLEAFRKMLHRHGIDKQEMRINLIARIMKNLVRENCSFEKILPFHEPEMKLLSEAKENYYWNPAGYEVIRFDEWLMKKVS
jgi:tetratricopeptide (TPR) repeat protein